MGRWSYLDSDEERLPEGMVRVGYDADTQVYTYRDSDGSYWEGAPGARYGKLHRVRSPSPLPSVNISNDIEGEKPPYVLHDFYGSDTDESSGEGGDLTFSYHDDGKTGASPRSPNKVVLRSAGTDRPKLHQPTPSRGSKILPRLNTTAAAAVAEQNPDMDFDRLSTASTVRGSISSAHSVKSVATSTASTAATVTNNENDDDDVVVGASANASARATSGLRRSGTLSRLARFLSPSSSSSSSSSSSTSPSDPGGQQVGRLSRRATVHGSGGGGGGTRRKEDSTATAPSRSSSFASSRRSSWGAAAAGGGGGTGNARWPGPGSRMGSGPGGQRRKCPTTFEEILGE